MIEEKNVDLTRLSRRESEYKYRRQKTDYVGRIFQWCDKVFSGEDICLEIIPGGKNAGMKFGGIKCKENLFIGRINKKWNQRIANRLVYQIESYIMQRDTM